ncbi:hypothetical protein D3C80_1436780 [compost metagenome]
MADDVDHRAVVFVQHPRHVGEDGQEAAVDRGLVGGEGHIRGHAQHQGVALTGHADAGAGQLGLEGALLTIHVLADARACERADAGADQGVLAALFAAGGVGQIAQQGAAQGAGDGAGRGVVAVRRRAVGIGRGAGAGAEHGGEADAGDDELGAHGKSFG